MLQLLTIDLASLPSNFSPLSACDPPRAGMDAGGGGLIAATQDLQICEAPGICSGSRVLTIVAESAVDVPGCRKLTGLDPAQVAQVRA